jgi:hypothetical protein
MPSPHEIREGGSIRYPSHDDVPMATDGDDISIHTTANMEKYESLRHREFAHICVYDVDSLERVGLDEELPTILWTYLSHYYPKPSLRDRTSTSARYPNWYAPLKWYVSYWADQAKHAVEGIGRLEERMDDFATVQIEMQAYIDSQTSIIYDLFGHFGINPDA